MHNTLISVGLLINKFCYIPQLVDPPYPVFYLSHAFPNVWAPVPNAVCVQWTIVQAAVADQPRVFI